MLDEHNSEFGRSSLERRGKKSGNALGIFAFARVNGPTPRRRSVVTGRMSVILPATRAFFADLFLLFRGHLKEHRSFCLVCRLEAAKVVARVAADSKASSLKGGNGTECYY